MSSIFLLGMTFGGNGKGIEGPIVVEDILGKVHQMWKDGLHEHHHAFSHV